MAKARYLYPCEIEADEDGWLVVRFPDLPEALTGAPSRAEALAEAVDCLEEALAARILDRRAVPAPSAAKGRPTVAPGALMVAKAALFEAARDAGLGPSQLAVRLGVQETEARRMLHPRHATKIGRLEAALAALGKRIVVSVEPAA
ncbi:MAG: type II toxin-antitoxin system HicB family antitoxin [Azospirillaceae bacterium]